MKALSIASIASASLLLLYAFNATAQKITVFDMALEAESAKKIVSSTASSPKQDHEEALRLARNKEFSRAADLLAPYAKQAMKYVLITGDHLVFLSWSDEKKLATDGYERLPSTFPKSIYLLRNIAKAYYDQHRYTPAASLYAKVLELDPTDKQAQKGLSLSLHHAGKTEGDGTRLNDHLKNGPNALEQHPIKSPMLISHSAYAKRWGEQADLIRRTKRSSIEQHRAWESLLASVPKDQRKPMTAELKTAASSGQILDIENYILALALQRQFSDLVTSYESAAIKSDHYSPYAAYWIGWAYFKADKLNQSEQLYRTLLRKHPENFHANTGLAYLLGRQKKPQQAFALLDQLPTEPSLMSEIHFVRAYIHEQQSDYWSAIQEYDAILTQHPDFHTAKKLKLMALSALGASSQALSQADQDNALKNYIRGDMAIDRMHWSEFKLSLKQLEVLMQNRVASSRFDRIAVLVKDLQMKQAIAEYQMLKSEGVKLPYWLMNSIGHAFFYLDAWENALSIYNQALESDPTSLDARLGKFYALSKLRRWSEAETVLHALEKDVIPEKGRSSYTQDQQMEVLIAHGWFLIDQDMLREADQYFSRYHNLAPANTELRSALAHTHHFRGWPRQALRELQTIRAMETRDINPGPSVGHAKVLNELSHKEQARDMLKTHLTKQPRDKHGMRVSRELEVDEMHQLNTNLVYEHSNDGFDDVYSAAEYSHPINLYSNFLAMMNYRRSSQAGIAALFQRIGVGFDHTFNSDWFIREMVSMDVNAGGEYGSQTYLRYTPTDHWIFEPRYDSFTMDVPLRARVAGITANLTALDVTYRQSEWREFGLGSSYSRFSDGNRNIALRARTEQGLLAQNNWRMSLMIEGDMSKSSLRTAPYFNPSRDWSSSATLKTEHTLWQRQATFKEYYTRSLIHHLNLNAGIYGQQGFKNTLLSSIGYGQEIIFSDTHQLLWDFISSRHSYDGVAVSNYAIDATYQWLF